jgi:hypothetical protein
MIVRPGSPDPGLIYFYNGYNRAYAGPFNLLYSRIFYGFIGDASDRYKLIYSPMILTNTRFLLLPSNSP